MEKLNEQEIQEITEQIEIIDGIDGAVKVFERILSKRLVEAEQSIRADERGKVIEIVRRYFVNDTWYNGMWKSIIDEPEELIQEVQGKDS